MLAIERESLDASIVMRLIQAFSRNYTSTIIQIAEKCGFYNIVEKNFK
jgi:hypothetical protein